VKTHMQARLCWVMVVAMTAALLASLGWASAAAATPGIDATWGNLTQNSSGVGGLFGDRPRGVAVNWASGDVYVSDTTQNRIERFTAGTTFNAGVFEEAWGKDVDSANPSTGYEHCLPPVGAEADHCKAGATGTLGGEFSGPAGIAVNQSTGHVYVIDVTNLRIQELDEDGNFIRAFGKDVVQTGQSGDNPAASARQTLTVTASGGKYTLEFEGQKTAELPFNASAATVQAALLGLSRIGAGNVEVTGASSPLTITFKNNLANNPEPAIAAASAAGEPLSGGSASVAIVTAGSTGFEICEAAASCKTGVSGTGGGAFGTFGGNGVTGPSLSPGSGLAVAPVGAPNAGDVLVANAGNRRIEEFTPAGQFVRAFAWDVVAAGPDNKNFASGPDQANEVQAVTVKATAGQFRLKFSTVAEGVAETPPLAAGASAAEVQNALNALTNVSVGGGSVAVSGGPGDATGSAPYEVTFNGGPLAGSNVAQISAINVSLSGGSPSSAVLVSTLANGNAGFEVCAAAAFDACSAASEGAGRGQFSGATLNLVTLDRIAEDKAGRIYTVEPIGNFRVQRFTLPGNVPTPQGEFAPALLHGTADGAELAKDNVSEVAVDDAGYVYVAKAFPVGTGSPPAVVEGAGATKWQQRVLKLDPNTGAVVATMAVNPGTVSNSPGSGSTYNFQSTTALTVAPDGSRLYATTAISSSQNQDRARVWRLGEIAGLGASGIEAEEVQASTAKLVASITPAQIPLGSMYRFEYSEDGLTWKRAPQVDAELGNGSVAGTASNCPTVKAATCQVSREIDGLVPGTAYQLRLVVYSLFDKGRAQALAGAVFTTKASVPTIRAQTAHWSGPAQTQPSLFLGATINPGHVPTSYQFEYVDDASYQADKAVGGSGFEHGQATGIVDAGRGVEDVEVHEVVQGLDPALSYHYRLVATNEVGTSPLSEREVGPPTDTERYYELVSAGDSGGSGVTQFMGAVADSGGRASFQAQSFNDPRSVPGFFNEYISVRGSDGWALTRTEPSSEQWNLGGAGLAPDLGARVLTVGSRGESERYEGDLVVARIDGSLESVMKLRALQRSGTGHYVAPGFSADLSRIFVKAVGGAVTLLPGEGLVSNNKSNLYEVSGVGGVGPALTIVNRANGKAGAVLGGSCGGDLANGPRAVSVDASAVYFSASPTAPAPGLDCPQVPPATRLYERVGGETTIEVSKTQCTRVAPPCHATGSGDLSAATGAGNLTAGSKIVTGVTTASGAFAVGQTISARIAEIIAIPNDTTIAAVKSPTELELSANATSSGSGVALSAGSKLVKSVVTASGAFAVGETVYGAGVADNTTIAAVKSPTELELSQAVAAAGIAVALSAEAADTGDVYKGASADGRVVFFTTTRPLVNGDEDSTADLYAYDTDPPAGQPNLVQVSAGEAVAGKHEVGKGANVLGTLDNAEDGSRVYFVAEGVLTGENPALHVQPAAAGKNIYAYERDAAHPAGRIVFVGAMAPGSLQVGDADEWSSGATSGKQATALPVTGSGSAPGDGHALLLVSKAKLVPSEDADAAKDLYRYDSDAETLLCLSCHGEAGTPPGTGAGNFEVRVDGRPGSYVAAYAQAASVASADLATVVFATKEKLSAEDDNETWDAYAWQEGQIELISRTGSFGMPENSGKQVAISPDGRNIFFITRATLVGGDSNNTLDVYDARTGGGFPEKARARSCGDTQSCQGEAPPPSSAAAPSPGSESLRIAGNPAAPVSCPRGRVRRGGRCVKKPAGHRHRRHHRRTGHNGGGGR
jgi:hypothetical protein